MADAKMVPYNGPISHDSLGQATISLLGIGLLFASYFFVTEVTSSKWTRSLVKEVISAAVASVFLGAGTLCLLLWVGIYV